MNTSAIMPMRRTKMPVLPIEKQYPKVEPMLKMLAKKYATSFKLDFDDVLGEANALFVRAYRKYDTGKQTKFSSFLYTVVNNGLINFGLENTRPYENRIYADKDADPDSVVDVVDAKSLQHFKLIEFYDSLFADEKMLVDVVLMQFVSTFAHLQEFARKRLGFTKERFQEAVSGIRQAMEETWH